MTYSKNYFVNGIIKNLSEFDWKNVPVELYAFIAYEVVESVITIISQLILKGQSRDYFLPLSDWNLSNGLNIIFVFFALILILQRDIKIRNTLICLLMVSIVFGLIDLFLSHQNFKEIFTLRTKWGPFWNLFISVVWLCVFLNPRVKKYCNDKVNI